MDITSSLQQLISQECSKNREGNSNRTKDQTTFEIPSIKLEGGDYGIQMLEIPKNGKILLFSKDRVRLLYVGKRNRPMFTLGENSFLALKEKLEIYYNTNNVQEVTHLMIRLHPTSRVEISKGVKVSLFSQKIE